MLLSGMKRKTKRASIQRVRNANKDMGFGDRNTNVNRLKSRWQWDPKYFSYAFDGNEAPFGATYHKSHHDPERSRVNEVGGCSGLLGAVEGTGLDGVTAEQSGGSGLGDDMRAAFQRTGVRGPGFTVSGRGGGGSWRFDEPTATGSAVVDRVLLSGYDAQVAN